MASASPFSVSQLLACWYSVPKARRTHILENETRICFRTCLGLLAKSVSRCVTRFVVVCVHVCALGYRNWAQQWLCFPSGGPLQSPLFSESWCMSPPYPDLPEFPRFTSKWESTDELICRKEWRRKCGHTVGEEESGTNGEGSIDDIQTLSECQRDSWRVCWVAQGAQVGALR